MTRTNRRCAARGRCTDWYFLHAPKPKDRAWKHNRTWHHHDGAGWCRGHALDTRHRRALRHAYRQHARIAVRQGREPPRRPEGRAWEKW